MRRSSIFSSETLVERPQIAPAVWIALAICVVFRFGVEPLRDLPKADRKEDLYDFRVVEKFFVEDVDELPQVIMLGSSISMYAFVPELLARELSLPETAVRNLPIPGGAPWDSLMLLRRNPKLLENAKVALIDVQPYMLNADYEYAIPDRFYNLASLADAARAEGWSRVRAVANWFWPFVSLRRPMRAWALEIENRREGVVPFKKAAYYPMWHPDATYPRATEAELSEALSAEKHRPANWADLTLGEFDFSERQADALRDLLALLKAHGVAVLIHQPPFHPDFYARAAERPEERQALARYFSFLEEVSGDGVMLQIWKRPAELGFRPEDLPDYGHMPRRLAERYTRTMAAIIREKGWLDAPAAVGMAQPDAR